jgi:hypothetical protein
MSSTASPPTVTTLENHIGGRWVLDVQAALE